MNIPNLVEASSDCIQNISYINPALALLLSLLDNIKKFLDRVVKDNIVSPAFEDIFLYYLKLLLKVFNVTVKKFEEVLILIIFSFTKPFIKLCFLSELNKIYILLIHYLAKRLSLFHLIFFYF